MLNLFEIVPLAKDIDSTIAYLREKRILKNDIHCASCRVMMGTVVNRSKADGFVFRCPSCRKMLTIRTGSFLTRSKLSLGQSLMLIYLWALKMPVEQTAIMIGTSERTVVDWNNLIREVCSSKFAHEAEPTLGGPGRVVQIDESLVYKAKHNRGHALFEQPKWVFGIYDVSEKVGAVEFVESRTAEVLLPLIRKHVIPGTEIHSDQWPAYTHISDMDVQPPFIHRAVNHSRFFRDPQTGVHTNNVEAYWSSIKRRFKMLNGTSRALTPSYLDEHMYRERFGRTYSEMFTSIANDIATFGI